MPNQDIYYVELIDDGIDFESSDSHPKAHFKLTSNGTSALFKKCKCARKIHIKYKAIVEDNINMFKKKIHLKINRHGKFWFRIPKHTIGLEVKIKAHNSCKSFVKIESVFPIPCKPDFNSSFLTTRQMIKHCNKMAIDTTGLDHTPVAQNENRIFGHQLGPCRSSRAMAIIHIAMFEALISIVGGYTSYLNLSSVSSNASIDAAIAQAAHDSTVWLFPSHAPRLDDLLATQLSQIPNGLSKTHGIATGIAAAQAIITLRTNDGSQIPEPLIGVGYFPSGQPGEWNVDPISQNPKALGAFWSQVTPFVIPAASTYRCTPPPSLNSPEYTTLFNNVKSLGGDGVTTVTVRSEEETFIGIYWAYDGTPSLCAPPRLYNQIAMQIADQQGLDTIPMMRMLTLINVGMADTAIASWESKYFYKLWRPITAIRGSDMSPGDGNADTIGDINWTPLGAPSSNLLTANGTPNFPSYPSGHASFFPTLAQILRHVYGTDDVPFTFVSDEFNGITKDNQGNVRPYRPRSFLNLTQAEYENGISRIYLGIHYVCDKDAGIILGRAVGDDIYAHLYQPN